MYTCTYFLLYFVYWHQAVYLDVLYKVIILSYISICIFQQKNVIHQSNMKHYSYLLLMGLTDTKTMSIAVRKPNLIQIIIDEGAVKVLNLCMNIFNAYIKEYYVFGTDLFFFLNGLYFRKRKKGIEICNKGTVQGLSFPSLYPHIYNFCGLTLFSNIFTIFFFLL